MRSNGGFRDFGPGVLERRGAMVRASLPAADGRKDRSEREPEFAGSRVTMEPGDSGRLVVASYNVHRCFGRDGRCDPSRTAIVIRELGADIVALQGVESTAQIEGGVDQFELLAFLTDFEVVAGPTLRDHRGHYGNALLTRLPVRQVRRVDLSIPGREARGALDVELERAKGRLRVVTTHLGLGWRERRLQIDRILEILRKETSTPLVLLGDTNAWLPLAHGLSPLNRYLGSAPSVRTFPARLPLFPPDRIWAWPSEILATLRAHRSFLARDASDHLPIRAELRFLQC